MKTLAIAPICLAIFSLAGAASAHAADAYPGKPIRLIHGYGSGSSMDVNARVIAQKLTEYLGQSVVVELRPGATGTIAAELVARSPPDGYTLLAAPSSSLAATPHLQKVRFDTLRDFSPVAPIGEFALLLAGHPGVPVKSMADLIALAKRQPGRLSYGSNGTGSAYHLAGELLCLMAGIRMLHVPYRGGGSSAITDLVSGRVDMMWNNPVFLLPQVKQGKLRAYAVTAATRVAAMPDVPTIAETVPGYEMSGWQGIVAPAGTPKEIVAQLNQAIHKALAAPDIRTLWTTQGMEPTSRTSAEFTQQLRADFERYGKLIQKLGKIE